MKQLRIFSALLMCLFALSFAGCSKDDDNNNDTTQFEKIDLYGGWKYDSGDDCFIFYFSDDGSNGLGIEIADSKNYDRYEIIYIVSSDVTNLTIIEEDGDKDKYTIHLLNGEKLVLEDDEEDIYILKRYTGNIDEEFPVKVDPMHEAVDLGLSVKWATCNVGATSPEEYGDYFAWGETEPKSTYTYENCKTWEKKIDDISGNATYDAATANWGGSWRMPTRAEMQELMDNCTWTWTTQNGVKGYKVKSKKSGNNIFLPAAGYRYASSLNDAGEDGCYWSSTPDEYYTDDASGLWLRDYTNNIFYPYYRGSGLTVRPVSQ